MRSRASDKIAGLYRRPASRPSRTGRTSMRLPLALACVAWACAVAANAHAQNPDPMDIRGCTAIESDAQRLACYDQATGRVNLPVAQKRQVQADETGDVFGHDRPGVPADSGAGNSEVAVPGPP